MSVRIAEPGYRDAMREPYTRSTVTANVKISFVSFDEIDEASDALRNLLLGILDKGHSRSG